ncbi:MAG: hypothetical protein JST94_06565 [Bacteroidetes bacterium]|nr:hypothetical protein [Bacteroidota bacterium]MBS1592254.1 hypothetical protein [Bacteroidota bacterium]MBS1639293.1 hypothetical protein [Bacteroidota bacterium]MBS1642967.1 hypothetical protein [Bacteroidota bacterium]MBS1671100.1 hypothetical protein [Bacteroidota bacterium]
METKKSRAKYWLYFTFWLALMVYALFDPNWRQWFWVALPGVATQFSLGMDII